MNKTLSVTGEFRAKCPCGADIFVSIEDCSVAHTSPPCAEFNAYAPDAFLKYVNDYFASPRNN